MKPDPHDPNNHVPEFSPDDAWDDSDEAGDERTSSLARRTVEKHSETDRAKLVSGMPAKSERKVEPAGVTEREEGDYSASPVGQVGNKRSRVYEIGSDRKTTAPLGKPSVGPVLSQDGEGENEGKGLRRRKKSGGERQDWGKKQNEDSGKWMLWAGFGAVIAVVVLALFISQRGENEPVRDSEMSMFSKLAPVVEAYGAGAGEKGKAAEFEKLALQEEAAKKLYETYVNARSPDEFLEYVHNREELGPLIRENWNPVALGGKKWNVGERSVWQVNDKGESAFGILTGEMPDFSAFAAYFVSEGDGISLAWKATVGYSSAGYDKLAQGRGDASEIRAWVEPAKFYTFSLPDSEYLSFRLTSPDRETNLWGYVPLNGELFEEFSELFISGPIIGKQVSELHMVLKLVPGTPDSLPNQWIIDELVETSWLD